LFFTPFLSILPEADSEQISGGWDFMFLKLISILLSVILLAGISTAQETDTLYLLQTTDIHGNIFPWDYFRDQEADYGLAKIYTRVTDYRLQHKNVILLDGGDLLQGTPLAWLFNKVETALPNPMILTLNYMGYDAFAVGNHDIEQGPFVYLRAQREAQFPWLAANAILPDGRTFFTPYAILARNGIRIGIIGLTTPGIPMWLDKSLYPGVTWADMVTTARQYAEFLRPQVDILVGLFHAGFNEAYSAASAERMGLPNENASGLVARHVPGFDIVFAGHSHQPQPKDTVTINRSIAPDEVLQINAGSWGRNLGVAQILLTKKSAWKITGMKGWLEPTKDVLPSEAILQLTDLYHKKTLDYIRTEIATLSDTLTAVKSRMGDSPLMELINRAQMQASGADLSFAACFDDRLIIAPGIVRIKDIYGMYRYENFLYLVEMTGSQIKSFLEYCAGYYEWDGRKLTFSRNMQGYNYDMAEGVRYKIDVKKEAGQRISDLVLIKTGKPLAPDKIYKAAMNSYRATGGGGHMAAAEALNNTVLWKSDEEMRTILVEYIRQLKTIKPQADHNWEIIQ
jgi:2',3'-cyclic-nucleotide 2'-phosphodiesterase/3'-nucleotidase